MAGGIEYPQSWTDIANHALGLIGKPSISNIESDTSDPAVQANLFIGEAVETVCHAHKWLGLRKRAQLTPADDTPSYGFSLAYNLPSDCILPIQADTGGLPYEIDGEELLTDSPEAFLTYVPRPADVTVIPPHIRKAIEYELAALLCPGLTSDDKLAARIESRNEVALSRAKIADAGRRQARTLKDDVGFTYTEELR